MYDLYINDAHQISVCYANFSVKIRIPIKYGFDPQSPSKLIVISEKTSRQIPETSPLEKKFPDKRCPRNVPG